MVEGTVGFVLLCDTPGPMVSDEFFEVLKRGCVVTWCVVGGFGWCSACFRHAGGCVCFQWFWGCLVGVGLRSGPGWCKFSLRCLTAGRFPSRGPVPGCCVVVV